MTRYLIEVPHEGNQGACDQAKQAFLATGSHFMTNADWGCADHEHKAWFIAEFESKDEARLILPPIYRERAKITTLQKFTLADLERDRQQHQE
jgi:hypothetical protein